MTESIYQFVLDELEVRKGRWREVATATGISHRTIGKIARREIPNPGIRHIETLAAYFRRESSGGEISEKLRKWPAVG